MTFSLQCQSLGVADPLPFSTNIDVSLLKSKAPLYEPLHQKMQPIPHQTPFNAFLKSHPPVFLSVSPILISYNLTSSRALNGSIYLKANGSVFVSGGASELWIPGKHRWRVRTKSVLCYYANRELEVSMSELSRRMNVPVMAISHAVQRGAKIVKELNITFSQANSLS